jgi:hypothetical protein
MIYVVTGCRFLKISSLAVYVSIFFLLTSCNILEGKQGLVADTSSIDLSKENIDGIILGENIKESNLKHKYEIEVDEPNTYYLDKKYYIVTNEKDEIIYISVKEGEPFETGKGIKAGDRINQVIKKYGKNYYKYTNQGVQTIGYVDHENKCKIDFWYVDDKVFLIELSNKDFDL